MATKSPILESLLRSDFLKQVQSTIKPDTEIELIELKEKPMLTLETVLTNQDSLANIINTQKQLSQVKDSLGTLIDSLTQNPSILNRASNYFGELFPWQKIGMGIALPLPTLAVGIFAHVGVLLIISGAIVVTYTTAGVFLEDHYNCNVDISDRLKTGLFNLADILEITINALETIRIKLADEIKKFKVENIKLAQQVNNLGNQIETLDSQVQCYIATEKILCATKEKLEQTEYELKQSVTDQSRLLEENQEQLKAVTGEYKRSQEQLSEKIEELNSVKVKMKLEVEKAQKIAVTLQGAVSTLSGTVISDKKQRQDFQNRLDDFITDKEKSFDQVAARICDTEQELSSVKDELKFVKEELNRSLEYHKYLLNEQGAQIDRLKAVNPDRITSTGEQVSSLLGLKGFFSKKSPEECYTGVKESLPLVCVK
jgi:ABC-type transporter Mla subunit MlaD